MRDNLMPTDCFMTEDTVWNQLRESERQEDKGFYLVMIAGLFLIFGLGFCVSVHKVLVGLPILLLGVIFYVLGVRRSTSAIRHRKLLLYDQLGPFAQREYENEIGSFCPLESKRVFRSFVEESGIFDKFNRFEGSHFLTGRYEGFEYTAGNVHLIFEERGFDRGDDLDLETRYITIFKGIWMHCDMGRECSISDDKLQELKNLLNTEVHCLAHEDLLELAVDTAYGIYSFRMGMENVNSVEDMKRAFSINLAYEKRILSWIASL